MADLAPCPEQAVAVDLRDSVQADAHVVEADEVLRLRSPAVESHRNAQVPGLVVEAAAREDTGHRTDLRVRVEADCCVVESFRDGHIGHLQAVVHTAPPAYLQEQHQLGLRYVLHRLKPLGHQIALSVVLRASAQRSRLRYAQHRQHQEPQENAQSKEVDTNQTH